MLIIGGDGRLLLANDEARRLLGLAEDAQGLPVPALNLDPPIAELLTSGRPASDEVQMAGDHLLSVNVRPTAPYGGPAGNAVTLRDTTELGALAGRAETARERLSLLQREAARRRRPLHRHRASGPGRYPRPLPAGRPHGPRRPEHQPRLVHGPRPVPRPVGIRPGRPRPPPAPAPRRPGPRAPQPEAGWHGAGGPAVRAGDRRHGRGDAQLARAREAGRATRSTRPASLPLPRRTYLTTPRVRRAQPRSGRSAGRSGSGAGCQGRCPRHRWCRRSWGVPRSGR